MDMMLNVVLRTSEKRIAKGDSIVPKEDCIPLCAGSMLESLNESGHPFKIHVVDEGSSDKTRERLRNMMPEATFDFAGDQESLVSFVDGLSEEELVYFADGDHLHYRDSVANMVSSWLHFAMFFPRNEVVIFPEDFNRMYYHPQNMFGSFCPRQCDVLPGPDRYFRTTCVAQGGFLAGARFAKNNTEQFCRPHDDWEEGSEGAWKSPEVMMLMPLGTFVVRLARKGDISFYAEEWKHLLENKT